RLGRFRFLAAAGLVLRGDLLEVVDVIYEAAFNFIDGGVHIAWDSDVDEEHRTVAAAVQDFSRLLRGEDLPRAGRGDDNVRAMRLGVELREGDDTRGDR